MTAHPQRLVSLWDMLKNYAPIYQLGVELEAKRAIIGLSVRAGSSGSELYDHEVTEFKTLLVSIQTRCSEHGLTYTAEMAERLLSRPLSKTNEAVFAHLTHLNDSLESELRKESVFRIPPDRAPYYETNDLFGEEVAAAFPSCEHDIRNAGSCYALGQADACVHHLMLVLERGLRALAGKVGVPYRRTGWRSIINEIEKKLDPKSRGPGPKLSGPELDFYRAANDQFGFLTNAYRNHSQHAHEPYDLPRASSTLPCGPVHAGTGKGRAVRVKWPASCKARASSECGFLRSRSAQRYRRFPKADRLRQRPLPG
jgi:hypothetical protein